MWELDHKEGWVLKNWCFWTVMLEKILRIPWTARRSNQSILKKINPEDPLKGLMLTLQYFDHTYKPSWLTGKDPDVKKDWRQKDDRWDGWMASSIQWTWTWVNSKRWWGTGKPGVPQCMGSQKVRHDLVTEQQYTPQRLNTFTCWWVLRLLTHPGNCKWCFYEQWSICIILVNILGSFWI